MADFSVLKLTCNVSVAMQEQEDHLVYLAGDISQGESLSIDLPKRLHRTDFLSPSRQR